MNRIGVESSNIKAIGYNEVDQIMEVEFKSGQVYTYIEVPKPAYDNLMASDSKGACFNVTIRNKYKFQKENK